jgi:hypothetical protein
VTLTSSVRAPISSVRIPAKNLSFAFTTTFVCSRVLKPSRLTRSAYESGRTIGRTNRPSSSVVVVVVAPWVRLVNATVAPASAPPCVSTTEPKIDALAVCA